jgi:hypothetical protein
MADHNDKQENQTGAEAEARPPAGPRVARPPRESKAKTGIDIRRVERVKWILPMLRCAAPNVECWLIPSDGVIKRIYICFGLGYVVWLEPGDREGWWDFSSAYTIKAAAIREYLIGGKRIWPVKK